MTVRDLTFDEAPSEQSTQSRPYRAAQDRVDRVSVIFFQLDSAGRPDLTRPRVLMAQTQYHAAVGTVISRRGEPDADAELWDTLEAARPRYATLIVKYPTDAAGKVKMDASQIAILSWDFGEPTYRRLHELSVEQRQHGRNLGSVDLRVECTNTQKQFIQLTIAGPAIWRMKPEPQEKLLARALTLYDNVRIGRVIPDPELRRSLGLPPLSSHNDSAVPEFDESLLKEV